VERQEALTTFLLFPHSDRARTGGDHQPSAVAARGGTSCAERQANGFKADEPSRESARSAKYFNTIDHVFKRFEPCCGAVEVRGTLEADLAKSFRTFSPTRGGVAHTNTKRVKATVARERQG
jgi:hypothetical protein